jgi:hypothetical protein
MAIGQITRAMKGGQKILKPFAHLAILELVNKLRNFFYMVVPKLWANGIRRSRTSGILE